jgi:hypothetical protein
MLMRALGRALTLSRGAGRAISKCDLTESIVDAFLQFADENMSGEG